MRQYNTVVQKITWNKSQFLALFGLVLIAVSANWLNQLLKIDPFAKYRFNQADLNPIRVAITLPNVRIEHYDGKQIVSSAKVKSAQISQDRNSIQCFGITEGVFYGEENKQFKFSADSARYSFLSRRLEADQGARVMTKDVDLKAQSFGYSLDKQTLHVQTAIQGEFYGGNLTAASLQYRLKPETYTIGEVTWEGMLETPMQEGKRTAWKIKAKSGSRPPGDIEIWNDGEATDGEIVVKADKIERNVKTDVIVATGKVRYYSPESNLLGDKVTVFRKEKRALVEGHTQLFIKPEDQEKLEVVELAPLKPIVPDEIAKNRPPAPQTDDEKRLDDEVRDSATKRKYPTIVWANRIEYWYTKGERRAVITGSPQARQELSNGRWRQVWATKAFFNVEKDLLRMESANGKKTVRVRNSIGDDLVAKWFTVSTKENDDTWSGEGVEGEVYADEEEVPARDKKKETESDKKQPPPLKGEIKK